MTISNQNDAPSKKVQENNRKETPISTSNSNLITDSQALISRLVNSSFDMLTNLFIESEVKKLPPHKSNIMFLDVDDSSSTSDGLPYNYPGNQRTSEDSSGDSTLNSSSS